MGLTRIRAEQISDIDYKQAVRVITLSDISLSGGAPNQVDGVNLIANDRVLVAGNDPASENGLYIVQTVGAGSNGTWVRSSDGNSAGEIEAGMIVMVTEGVVYKDTQWKLTTNNPIVIGSTSLVFELNNSNSSAPGNTISNGTSNVSIPVSNSNVTVSVGETANVLVVTSTGANITGTLNTGTGNITGGNLSTAGSITATGNVLVGNVIVANNGANGISLYQSNGTTKATNTTGVILALGDSWIGGGYMPDSTTVWANVAARAFQATIVNRAVGGRLSADVLANLTADVAAAGGYNNINCAVINVGGNDKLQDPAANIAQYNTTLYNNLTSILNVLTGNGVPVILSPAPDFDRDDFYITGIAPDYAAPINTGQYVDDPQYAVIANNYQGVTVSTNSMSYLFNHPAEFLIPGGFHPTLTNGQQCFVDIIASAGQGLNQNSLNAAMTMDFDLIGFNQGIEIGTTTLASTPFIDFHSSGNSTVDYDSRIIGSGGNGTAGTGNINFFTNTANISGNVLSSGSVTASGNITASYFLGNGSQLTGIATSYGNANVVANLAALASNPINTTGNITAGYFIGNGSQLTGLPASYSDANVATFMAAFGSNTIVTTGNITGGNVISNGVRAYKWTTVANTAPSNAVAGDNWYDSYSDKKYQYTYDGTSSYWVDQSFPSTYASLTITGNTTTGNLSTSGVVTATGNITGGNLVTVGAVSATGNIGTAGALSVTGNLTIGNIVLSDNGAQGLNITQLNGNKANNSAGVVLAMGDSWLWGGYDIPAQANAVNNNSMERAFGKPVINQGQAGQTSAQIIAKLPSAVAACGGWDNIDLFVLNVGTGEKIQDPAANIAQYNTTIYTNLNTILTEVTGNGVPVVMAAVANISRNDLFVNGIPPDYAQFYLTGQYYDDPEYAVIAANYPGVALAENAWTYLMNNPDPYLGNNGTAFHPSVPVGAQAFIDILAGASTGVAAPAIYAALGNVVNFSSYNQALELGLNYQVNTPHIDFFTSGNSSTSYDTRISATGGTGVAGTGTLTFYTATANITGNITGGNLTTLGTLTVSSIVNANANGVGNIGSATGYFNTVFAKATSAQYADLAELYVADAEYAPGTVVEFGGVYEITASKQTHSSTVAGIISTQPSYLMNSAQTGEHVLPVALTGRVPCQVVGKIRKGDRLVASDIPGVAIALDQASWTPGCIIGKSLEVYDSDDVGVIEVAVGRT